MTVVLITLIIATVVTDMVGDPPTYLTGLLGTAAGVWFAAIAGDKKKFDAEVAKAVEEAKKEAGESKTTAERAEAKADTLAEVAVQDHPDVKNPRDLGPSFNDPSGA